MGMAHLGHLDHQLWHSLGEGILLDTDQDSKKKKYKSFQLPGAKPHYNPDRPGQVEHIALDLDLDIPNRSISGTCAIRLNPVRNDIKTLTLDAVGLQINSVAIADQAQPFDYDGEVLTVKLTEPSKAGQLINLAIDYAAIQPQRGIYFVTPTEHEPNKPTQVWTQGEDEDSRFWFPCFDYPGQLSTSELKVRVPENLIAISNGDLVNVETAKGKTKTYHWQQQQVHPNYLITLAVGDFLEIKDEWRGKPVTYYVDKSFSKEDALRTMGKTPQMLEFFSEKYGYEYAFPKYAQVCVADFIFGGMENTSTTLLTDRCVLDQRAAIDDSRAESLVAHELAHQWFGDLVVIKHWSHAWIKEGAATYSEVMWTEKEYGAEEAAYYRLGEARSYFAEDKERYRRPIVTHVYREAIELYDRHLYEKAGAVYHMLRTELGEELFWRAIHTFVQTNAHSTVETVDLLRAIETATGKNCLSLFDQYVFRGGHPEYKLSYSWDDDNKLAKVTVNQTQDDLFDLKLPIAFGMLTDPSNHVDHADAEKNGKGKSTKSKSKKAKSTSTTNGAASADATDITNTAYHGEVELKTFTVRVFEKEQSFYFPLDRKPEFISFDHGNNYLKTVTLEYNLAELKAGLQHNPDPLARIQAAEAIAKKGGLEAVKALEQALLNDRFWGVRVEVADALTKINLDQATMVLAKGLADENAKVRRAVIEALGKDQIQ
jgi:aminopeptidase N